MTRVLLALIFAACAGNASWAATFAVKGGGASLVAKTANAEVEFSGPDVIKLTNTLTGETYTASNAASATALARLKMAKTGDAEPGKGAWKIVPGGAKYVAEPSQSKPTRFTVSVGAKDGALVLRCEGKTDSAGVRSIAWGIGNLSLRASTAVLPVRAGRSLSLTTKATSETYDYPTQWEAQFALICGKDGAALVYSADSQAKFKFLTVTRSRDDYRLVFETESNAPFTELKSADSTEWRIECFKGDWRTAVSAYRDRAGEFAGFFKRPSVVQRQKWPDRIRGTARFGEYKDVSILDEFARRVDARKTMLYLHDWRKDGYDVNYPDYTAKPEVAAFTKHAQKLGFKVMFHVDLPGVSPEHPTYAKLKPYHVLDKTSGTPIGWYWDKDLPQRFAFINPASREFRKVFVDAMREIVRQYKPDAVHLDVSAPMWNDANGLIEGMNYCQGSMRLHKELLAALPDLVLVGESINEFLAPYEHFVQRWAWPCQLDPHPVCAYLFDGFVKSYGYLGQPNPDTGPGEFLNYLRPYESQGVMPNAPIDSMADFGRPGLKRVISVMNAWQSNDLRPDWSETWPKDVLFQMTGWEGEAPAEPRSVKSQIARTNDGVRMTCGGKLLYQRAEGVTEAATSGHIPGHAAYDAKRAFGLDPEKQYWIEPGPPDVSKPHVSALPRDVILEEGRVGDDLASFRFRQASDVVYDLITHLSDATPNTITEGKTDPLGRGSTFDETKASMQGVVRRAIAAHPPWLPPPGRDTNPGGQTVGSYSVRLPDEPCRLEFSAGLSDAARESDGVTFIVNVNGSEAYRKHLKAEEHGQVDLTAYTNKQITIQLVTDPGPAGNTEWDHALWADPRIVRPSDRSHPRAWVKLPWKPGAVLHSRSSGQSRLAVDAPDGKGNVEKAELAMPGSVYYVNRAPELATLPMDLTQEPFAVEVLLHGSISPGKSWGSGRIDEREIHGTKVKSISGHPPGWGKTLLTWVLKLPPDKSRLAFTAGIGENAATDGVAFAVRVNGDVLWSRQSPISVSWDADIDLSDYAGEVIVLELVTDAMGECNCDWAYWAAPRILK